VFVAHNTFVDARNGIKEIAEELDLPTPYLGKVLQRLSKSSIIQSFKGPHGGLYLNETSQNIKIIKIIEVANGLDFFTNCGLGLKQCTKDHPCPLHDDFKIYRDGLWELFNTTSILDLVSKIEVGDAFIRNLRTE
jgi:Rrf2 family protein